MHRSATLAALALVVVLAGHSRAGEKEAAWLGDYDEAKAASAKTGKPIFLVFR